MRYEYTVKKNGVLYPAGTEVPEDASVKKNELFISQTSNENISEIEGAKRSKKSKEE